MRPKLAIIETHPVQYHAPVYRALQAQHDIEVTAIYGSDFSVTGYSDPEFRHTFSWDVDLLAGYSSRFLSTVEGGGARIAAETRPQGLRTLLKELLPDVILLTGYSPSFNRKSFLVAIGNRAPVLFRGETTDHAVKRSLSQKLLRDTFLRWAYRRCSILLHIGTRSSEHYGRLGVPPEKLVFSPYCIDASTFESSEEDRTRLRSATRDRLGISDEALVLLFSGKLTQRKGVHLLLPGIAQAVSEESREVWLLLLGGGEAEILILGQAPDFPGVGAQALGFKNQSEMSPYYHAADLLLLPSLRSETWGLVVNEALQHGLPCVVSDQVGCAPDLVIPGLTGEVCESGRVDTLSKAITRGISLLARPEVRSQCRRQVKGYSVQRAAEGLAEGVRRAADLESIRG